MDELILKKSKKSDHVVKIIEYAEKEKERLDAIKAAGGGTAKEKVKDLWRY